MGLVNRKAQNLVEYLLLFLLVAGASLILFTRAPGIFGRYVHNANSQMGVHNVQE